MTEAREDDRRARGWQKLNKNERVVSFFALSKQCFCDAPDLNALSAGLFECFCKFIDRVAGSDDVIDDGDVFGWGIFDDKSVFNIGAAVFRGQARLRLGMALALAQGVINGKRQLFRERFGKLECLIKAAPTKSFFMKWHGND